MVTPERGKSSANGKVIRSNWIALLLMAGMFVAGFSDVSGSSLSGVLVWKDAEGNPVPFQTLEEIEDFLLTAEVVKVKQAPQGTTAPRKVLLEKNGIRMYACFRYVKINRPQMRLDSGAIKFNFRDDAIFEVAAYRLARLLGFQNVPPTVIRSIQGKEGSLQAWVPNCMTEGARIKKNKQARNAWRWAMEVQTMQLFDVLIYNEDRNRGNVLIDPDWNLWMIDHTRSFRVYQRPTNLETVQCIERGVWSRLVSIPDEVIAEALGSYLTESQIRTLLVRRGRIVDYFQALIQQKGENQVLFTIWPEGERNQDVMLAKNQE